MSFLFFNSIGRVRSGWRFLLFVLAFLFSAAVIDGTLFLAAKDSPSLQAFLVGNGGFVVQNSITLILATILGFFFQKWFEDLPPKTLGWTLKNKSLLNFLNGVGAGFLTLAIAIAIAFLAGAVNFNLNDAGAAALLSSFLAAAVVFALGAAAEETLFRGYILQTVARARLAWLGVALTSLPFAAIHLGNPNVVPGFTFVNTALAGVWLGAAYLKTRELWFPFGVHFAWNFSMAQFFGIPVSGITTIAPAPFFKPETSNDLGWLSGGEYGIEGGAACTAALAISIALIWFAPFLKPDAELLALTSRENPTPENNFNLV